ncbi:MAG: P-loop NTPase [Ignavibacteria bacterium]|nr:P-loop NTPase [Ignavibacteria bacterium]
MTGQLDRIRELERLFNVEKINVPNKFLAVTSGKGGTGKTFFAANFAYQYAKTHKVLLIDLDFNLSNLHLLFNIHSQKTLNTFFESKVVFAEIITHYNSNLDMIIGDSGISNQGIPSFNQIDKMFSEINNLVNKYDLIVFDLGAGVSDANLHILSKAHTKLVITNPEPTSLMDAYVLIKLLKNNENADEIYIAVNRCLEESEGSQSFNNLKSAVDHFLKTSINFLLEIPESTEVRKSIIDQKLLAEHNKSSQVISSIKSAVGKISKIHQVFNINQPSLHSSSVSLKNSL